MMNAWAWHARAELLACAAGIGLLAAHVAFGLARGVAAADRGARWRRLASAGLALACGIWAALFVVVSGEALPGVPGYDGVALLGGFALTLAAALAAQALLASEPRTLARRAAAAAALGAAVCAAPVLALAALPLQAAPQWPALALPAAWLATTACTGLALALAPATRGALGRVARRRALGAAGLMAATLVGANAAVIASVELAALAAAVPPGLVGAEALTLLALLAAPAVLVLLLLALLLEERFRDLLARARDELQRASYTDVLTGLPNRLLFEERLQRAVHRADRGGQSLALLFVNLDGLKSVNEAFGQAAGDALLRIVGQRLRGLPGLALVARGSGDEFLLLVVERPEADAVARRAASILDEIARPCRVEPREVAVTASIGVALYPEHGALSRLIPHAAAALNAAKRLGGATYCFFDAQMVAGRREEVELLRDLRCAIEQRELELFYQPKIHAPSGQITGAEALMRWHHPRRGIVNPEQFIPLAEHYGLINALGNWVIEDACRQIRAWRNQGLRMRVAINLSVHQLRQADLAERIAAALKRYRLEPRLLTCEITESIAMDDSPQTLAVIEQLAAVGVHLSIDDFGTGYSNLSCLRKLPAEELKIDRGFILDLESSGDARAIVDAVVKLAQAIGLKVVAEGVETEQQQAILAQLGCDELQGYLFARPMSARALARWAMNHEGPRALDFRASLFGETRQVELA